MFSPMDGIAWCFDKEYQIYKVQGRKTNIKDAMKSLIMQQSLSGLTRNVSSINDKLL